jgi:hypothetical protein
MQKRRALLFTMMVVLLLPSCAVQIHEEDIYSPVPGADGVVESHFLSTKQQILTNEEWQKKILSMIVQGYSLECTFSNTIANVKEEIEKLCSKTDCEYEQPKPNVEDSWYDELAATHEDKIENSHR